MLKNEFAYFNGRSLFSGLAISYLLYINNGTFFISGIIGILLGILVILLFKKCNSKLAIFITNFVICVIASTILTNMAHSLYLKNTPIWMLSFIPFFGAYIMAKCSNRSLNRIIYFFFALSLVFLILKFIGLIQHVNFSNFMPVRINKKNIIMSSCIFMMTGVTPILSNQFIKNKKTAIIYYVISMISIMTICFLTVGVLGIRESIIYRYPEYVVLKKIEFLNFISNVDSLFNFAVIMDIMFTLCSCIKNLNIISNDVGTFISSVAAYAVITWFCYKNTPLLYIFNYFPYIIFITFLLLIVPYKRIKSAKKNIIISR